MKAPESKSNGFQAPRTMAPETRDLLRVNIAFRSHPSSPDRPPIRPSLITSRGNQASGPSTGSSSLGLAASGS